MAIYRAGTPLIVFRSNDISFLGILRSCKAANIPVVSIVFDWDGAGRWYSDFSSAETRQFNIENPHLEPLKAARQFAAIAKKLQVDYEQKLMVVPSSDTNLMFLIDHFDTFSPYINIMGSVDFCGNPASVVHKADCAELISTKAPELVPVTRRCSSLADIDAATQDMVYPAIYKPAVKDYGQTFYRAHDGSKAVECHSEAGLRAMLTREVAAGFELVVQEKIFFDSVYDEIPFYLYADENSRICMAANGIKELIDPFPFGTAIILRFAWCPELLEAAQKVVSALNYRGILMIEFVRDKKDRSWKVIEVNARPWLFNGFYQRLGLNFTDCLYRDLRGELNNNLILASDKTIGSNFSHIDVMSVASRWAIDTGSRELESFLDYLQGIEGVKTSAYYDPVDPEPGVQRFEDIAIKFGWDKSGLPRLVDIFD